PLCRLASRIRPDRSRRATPPASVLAEGRSGAAAMSLTRRAFGVGLVAASAAATGGYALLEGSSYFRSPTPLNGFVGGEKKSFLANPKTIEALRRAGIQLTPRQAGSVEMVRSPDLVAQNPDFLWPSSSVMVEIAHQKGIKIRRDQVILNS